MEVNVFKEQYLERLQVAKQMMAETNKASVLFVVQIPDKENNDLLLPITRESLSNIICFVEIGDASLVDFIIEQAEGIIDKIVLDVDHKRTTSREIIETVSNQTRIPVMEYSDLKMWGDSSVDFVLQNEKSHLPLRVLLLGHSYLTTHILQGFLLRDADIYMLPEDYMNEYALDDNIQVTIRSKRLHKVETEKEFDIIIGSNIKREYDCTRLNSVTAKSVYDIGLQNFSREYINSQMAKGIEVYRFDNRAAVSSVVLNLMETDELIKHVMGRAEIADMHIVSGGLMGRKGDIVIDHITNPHCVLGIADGKGSFIHECDYTDEECRNVKRLRSVIVKG
ncbi:MAG: hypothetical protein K5660_05320 [Paludibacteraceae bacterium]|nr:hypothetical protein [Paludibacteraceae bacterium]